MPNERKRHKGKIPMIGGLSIFIGLFAGGLVVPFYITALKIPLFFAFLVLMLGALDDALSIPAGWRLIIQILVVLLFLYVSGLRLFSFGNLFFNGEIVFVTMSGLLTVLAFCAGINAFNMIDGIDGLAALMGLVALVSMGVLFFPSFPDYFVLCSLFGSSLLAFFFMNLRPFSSKKKFFLGDAGSMFLGFMISFLLIQASQGQLPGAEIVMRPITCVWLIAIPLMDMVYVMLRRACRLQSPIQGDRNHLHHLLVDLGFSHRNVLFLMGCMAIFFAGVGLWGEIHKIPEGWMFFSYLFFFGFYLFLAVWLSRRLVKKKFLKVEVDRQ
ncbi:hypothetical protein LJC24_05610 [Desulfococcaceae bacterium OttesenSCG-928-F15]|nr:hypothetical protein [Desulfococcaceae bacterium OttesenSCG-928-F15]